MNKILEVKGLKKDFDTFCLDNVSFSLREGCITGFIGINGAGKTTTIKSILGLVLKDAGSIKLFGKDIHKNEGELKNHIGLVLDEGYFYEDMTVKEMKSVIAPAYSNWDESIFKSYIKLFQLQLNQKISTLSKGMRMKFALALALSHHADLLIMDEPTSGLDPLVRSELMNILLEFMKEDGKSVFFSTHITSDLDKVADELILIDKGKIILRDEKDVLLDTHGFVKGDKKMLNTHTRKLFLALNETEYCFEGVTNNKNAVREQMNGVLIERPSIENIMLSYIGGNNDVA
ncbi:ABC transporter ATP-binding protein [Oceanirhabdus sp. W0125-5]|uniref:ABC transporter ATP-binding protein n=1 Tax=Oceanirhabdus sp. W0125-5 TaxID=2999116 RepID=UPI0022F32661|nr:ABC transporter ATP-binding protein [Oceanirhabdus sp. W0125-5]WBW95781.1 ABC transporter ATP-binding protein [Oceanirhabdus sp. W0125-5]